MPGAVHELVGHKQGARSQDPGVRAPGVRSLSQEPGVRGQEPGMQKLFKELVGQKQRPGFINPSKVRACVKGRINGGAAVAGRSAH